MFLCWKQLSAKDCTREKIAIWDGIYGKVKRETQKNCAIWESKQTLDLQTGKFHGAITRATPRGSGTTIAVPGRAIGGTGTWRTKNKNQKLATQNTWQFTCTVTKLHATKNIPVTLYLWSVWGQNLEIIYKCWWFCIPPLLVSSISWAPWWQACKRSPMWEAVNTTKKFKSNVEEFFLASKTFKKLIHPIDPSLQCDANHYISPTSQFLHCFQF